MRRIKFEFGFDSANGIIKKVYFLSEIPNISNKCDVWGSLELKYTRQYIGLKDKNGKEIYEFDIVNLPIGQFGVIEFDKGLFGINLDFGTDRKTMLGSWGSETNLRQLYDGYYREIEVIGNIYENSELLKQ